MMIRCTMTAAALAALISLFTLAGCDGSEPAASQSQATPLPASALLQQSPGEPTPIDQLRKTAAEGDEVVIRAVVGGQEKPFVSGRAIMTVVDATLPKSCGVSPDDPCTTPWDYCCTQRDDLMPHLATVQLVDAEGKPLQINLIGSKQLEPLDTIIVRGTVGPRPDPSMLVINAQSLYVEPGTP